MLNSDSAGSLSVLLVYFTLSIIVMSCCTVESEYVWPVLTLPTSS